MRSCDRLRTERIVTIRNEQLQRTSRVQSRRAAEEAVEGRSSARCGGRGGEPGAAKGERFRGSASAGGRIAVPAGRRFRATVHPWMDVQKEKRRPNELSAGLGRCHGRCSPNPQLESSETPAGVEPASCRFAGGRFTVRPQRRKSCFATDALRGRGGTEDSSAILLRGDLDAFHEPSLRGAAGRSVFPRREPNAFKRRPRNRAGERGRDGARGPARRRLLCRSVRLRSAGRPSEVQEGARSRKVRSSFRKVSSEAGSPPVFTAERRAVLRASAATRRSAACLPPGRSWARSRSPRGPGRWGSSGRGRGGRPRAA